MIHLVFAVEEAALPGGFFVAEIWQLDGKPVVSGTFRRRAAGRKIQSSTDGNKLGDLCG
ncbi:hypothetical protein SJI00_02835 [Pseudomonas sp. RP23018S]|uniref:hypothetical protein n=1 Tax=Pseudomonas sp. RP23018S TaxID=3096037 RepID=UPI002ACA5B80|nr:hypothetical protein [Pseudomonas sp. RP23018S]MDZ5601714.1 hypothetical protein [Pseudomonas sp. RP23018S]